MGASRAGRRAERLGDQHSRKSHARKRGHLLLPRPVARGAALPHEQDRPESPPRLPPQRANHRSPPDHRHRALPCPATYTPPPASAPRKSCVLSSTSSTSPSACPADTPSQPALPSPPSPLHSQHPPPRRHTKHLKSPLIRPSGYRICLAGR